MVLYILILNGLYVESTRTYQDKPVVELYFNKEEMENQIKHDFYYDS